MSDIHIQSHDTGNQPEGQTWDTVQLSVDFEVLGFSAPLVIVKRRLDNVRGTLEFKHHRRLYWGFQPEEA